MNKGKLFWKAVRSKIGKKYDKFIEAEPMVRQECVTRTIHLLRRDFSIEEQNAIILDISRRLNELRDNDIIEMKAKLENMEEQTQAFKGVVIV